MIYSKNFTLAYVKEVGEHDALVQVHGEDIVVELDESTKRDLFDLVSDGTFLVGFDSANKTLLLNMTDKDAASEFPEFNLPELAGAGDEIDEEYQ